jgi:hypothetical protein
MSVLPATRRVDRFADLVASGGRTDDPVIGPYLAISEMLRLVPAPAGPRPEFRAALRQRLVAVGTVQGVGATASLAAPATARLREASATWRFQRRMAVVAGGAAAATAIAGVGVGASRSLPGDPFYGVKRATERVQLATAVGREAKGMRELQFARTRLHEVQALAGDSSALGAFLPSTAAAIGPLTETARTDTILATLRDMDGETKAGAKDLLAVARDSGSRQPLQALASFTRGQLAQLQGVLPALPSAAQPRARRSATLLAFVARVTAAAESGTLGQHSRGVTTPSAPATVSPTPGQAQRPARSGGGRTATPTPSGSSSSTGAPTIPSLPTIPPITVPTLPGNAPALPALPVVPTAPAVPAPGH